MKGKSASAETGLPFLKVEGAGNDFILLDARTQPIPKPLALRWHNTSLDRHRGVGADGLLILRRGQPEFMSNSAIRTETRQISAATAPAAWRPTCSVMARARSSFI